MKEKYDEAVTILKKYGQEHVLKNYEKFSSTPENERIGSIFK